MLLKIAFMALLPVPLRAGIPVLAAFKKEVVCSEADQIILKNARERLIEWTNLLDAEATACMCEVEAEARELAFNEIIEEFLLDILDHRIYELTGKNTPRRADIQKEVTGGRKSY